MHLDGSRAPLLTTSLFFLLLAFPSLATTAHSGSRVVATPSPAFVEGPETFAGTVLLETLSAATLAVAVDEHSEMGASDGWSDRLLVFVSETPIEPMRYEGYGILRVWNDHAVVVLPGRDTLLLSLSDAGDIGDMAGKAARDARRLGTGLALITHASGHRETLAEAVAAERSRVRVETMDSVFHQDPGTGDGTGEDCKSSCSAECHDGSSCTASCNTSQCAECEQCPASCRCATRQFF